MIAKKQNKIFFIQLNFDRMREVQTSKFQKYSKQLKTYRRQKKNTLKIIFIKIILSTIFKTNKNII